MVRFIDRFFVPESENSNSKDLWIECFACQVPALKNLTDSLNDCIDQSTFRPNVVEVDHPNKPPTVWCQRGALISELAPQMSGNHRAIVELIVVRG